MKYAYLIVAIVSLVVMGASAQVNPVPTINGSVSPQAVAPGSAGFTLTVRGAGFVPGTVVNWNGSPRSTTFISAGQIQAQISAADIAAAGSALITVISPPPGGGISSSSYGMLEIHTPTSTMTLSHPHHYSNGVSSNDLVATADLNGDSKLDLVQTGSGIEILLGNGDGTFSKSDFIPHVMGNSQDLEFGDFNNDGNKDFVFIQSAAPGFIHLCLGDGTGMFQRQLGFGSFTAPQSLLVGDFNRDGNLDIAVVDLGMFYILLGNGDGTFQPQQTVASAGTNFPVAADFNGDGILDLAGFDASLNFDVFLGNGDGTFQAAVASPAGAPVVPAFVNDFNGDGVLDLAFEDNTKIGVLLGNGDGSFQAPQFNHAFHTTSWFISGDFNSDGKSDLLAYQTGITALAALLIGNGDGTFQPKTGVSLPGPVAEHARSVVGDFNSDGLLDFAVGTGGAEVFVQKPQ